MGMLAASAPIQPPARDNLLGRRTHEPLPVAGPPPRQRLDLPIGP